jgi:NAD(P)-dependent dehydrogenase (short-subunit alcohol dehydrogenase family)
MPIENFTNSEVLQLQAKLTDADAMTQGHTQAICAAARAAQRMLALDASALLDVRQLLSMIIDRAGDLQNCVNVLAEEAGANSVDEREREASGRLWAQHHTLHGTPGTGSAMSAAPSNWGDLAEALEASARTCRDLDKAALLRCAAEAARERRDAEADGVFQQWLREWNTTRPDQEGADERC